MPRVPFDSLPTHARLWVFAADRPLSPPEATRVLDGVDAFLDVWAAHKVALPASCRLIHDQFLLIAVDESDAGASGCSVDALTREMRRLESAMGVRLVDSGPVYYRNGTGIARVSRGEFRSLAASGAVTPDTIVFDTSVTSMAALVEGRWEAPARRTWHGSAFFANATP